MKRMPHPVTVGVLIAALLTAMGAVLFVSLGIYDVSAVHPHSRLAYFVIKATRDRSVERRAGEIAVPPLGEPAQVAHGMALLREHCVRCHGAPGVAPEPFALGLQPVATPLAQTGRLPPASLYWIVRNGIKMTAMPAFEFRMDEAQLWAVVAAVRALPALSPADYRAMAASLPAVERQARAAAGPADPARGRIAVGQYGCAGCHAIPGFDGPEARVGPTLHGIGSRLMLGGVLPNSPENMAHWLRSPQSVSPPTAMPDLGVTERDARDMAAWLATLK